MKFGELLVAAGILQPDQLDRALQHQKDHPGRIGSILVKLGYITETELHRFLEVQLGVTSVDLKSLKIPPGVIRLLNPALAARYKVIPIRIEGHTLVVAMADPQNLFILDDLKFATGMSLIKVTVASENSILEALSYYYKLELPESMKESQKTKIDTPAKEIPSMETAVKRGQLDDKDLYNDAMWQLRSGDHEQTEDSEDDSSVDIYEIKDDEFDAPIVRLINKILINAVEQGASDIHIECHERFMKVRFRLDGLLQDSMLPPYKIFPALISRIKVMANMDIAIKRVPQDGHISVKYKDRQIDFRVSTLPTVFGEKSVIRILDKAKGLIPFNQLGFDIPRLNRLKSLVSNPQGMLLVTGPTGSGKTSTLHSVLNYINSPTLNIVTVEDPVEYRFEGINHVHVHSKGGVTFASALRSILRQDPDVIMIGEIRDRETAEIAIRAALTGHRVLSTLHTNSAIETLTRLIDMQIDPYMIGSSVLAVIGQRLIRRICPSCAIEHPIEFNQVESFGITHEQYKNGKFRVGNGCNTCHGSGYKGRLGIYELLDVNAEIRNLIYRKASLEEIEKCVEDMNYVSLRKDGICRLLAGMTTLEEVLRVTAKIE